MKAHLALLLLLLLPIFVCSYTYKKTKGWTLDENNPSKRIRALETKHDHRGFVNEQGSRKIPKEVKDVNYRAKTQNHPHAPAIPG